MVIGKAELVRRAQALATGRSADAPARMNRNSVDKVPDNDRQRRAPTHFLLGREAIGHGVGRSACSLTCNIAIAFVLILLQRLFKGNHVVFV